MEPTGKRARAIGITLAVLTVGVVAAVVVYLTRDPDRATVVIVDPATPATGQSRSAAAGSVPPSGVVVSADGTPVANAELLLAAGNVVDVYNAARRGGPSVRSDKEGRFAFAEAPAWTDLVVRCPQGFAHVRSDAMPADRRVVVRAWGRVEGVIRSGGTPQAGQAVNLYGQVPPRAIPTTNPNRPVNYLGGGGRVQLTQTVRTDADGRFVFARVAPGGAIVSRQYAGAAGQVGQLFNVANVDVAPGQQVQLEVGGTGRPVVGRVALDRGDGPLPISGALILKTDEEMRNGLRIPPDWATLGEPERAKIVDDWARRSTRAPLSAPVSVAADGTFRADDVPAGQHNLRFSNQSVDAADGRVETLAEGALAFVMPAIPGGRSDVPFDVGTVTVRVRPRVKVGAAAPPLEAVKADKGVVRLADYRGKYVLLSVGFDYGTMMQPDRGQLEQLAGSLRDRFGGEEHLGMLAVALPQQPPSTRPAVPTVAGWTSAVAPDWQTRLDPAYAAAPATYLIDDQGKVLIRSSPGGGTSAYAALERALGPMRGNAPGVTVVVEKLADAGATAAFDFKTLPTISKDDVGQDAAFSIVDGRKANFAGELRILNDGLGPRNDKDEPLMLTFAPGTVEGRLRADLGKVVEVEQVNTYAWYKDGNRWAQVFRVYGSDGSGPGFNAEPKNGTDPATCGWSLVAAVDTRDVAGGADLANGMRGQTGVSVRGESGGAMGKWRYLLFVTFATETHNAWGQTFWSEVDVVGR